MTPTPPNQGSSGGPVLYKNPETYLIPLLIVPVVDTIRVGIHSHNATYSMVSLPISCRLPEVAQTPESFLIDLEEGKGYVWTDCSWCPNQLAGHLLV